MDRLKGQAGLSDLATILLIVLAVIVVLLIVGKITI